MRVESIEVLSDRTNAAVMRHPGRAFPGILLQGDTLSNLSSLADKACNAVGADHPAYEELDELRGQLKAYLDHYKAVLTEHGMPLPFSAK